MSDPACPMIQQQIQNLQGIRPVQLAEQTTATAEQITAQANLYTAQATYLQAQMLLSQANDRKLAADSALMTTDAMINMLQFQFTALGCGTQ